MPGTRRRGLKPQLLEYVRSRPDRTATNRECIEALTKRLGYEVPPSSVRQALQDTELFEVVARGVHRAKAGA